MEKLTEATPHT